jgi:hypothetical protein
MLVERLAEGVGQAVGLAVQESIDKLPAPSLPALSPFQIHLDVAKMAFELVDNRLERMSFLVSLHPLKPRGGRTSQGYLGRAIGTHNQDAAALYLPSQVKEQVDRTAIGPLQVV